MKSSPSASQSVPSLQKGLVSEFRFNSESAKEVNLLSSRGIIVGAQLVTLWYASLPGHFAWRFGAKGVLQMGGRITKRGRPGQGSSLAIQFVP